MTQAESPTLRQKLERLKPEGANSSDLRQPAPDRETSAIDLAVWKTILSHTNVPGLKPVRHIQRAQRGTEGEPHRGQLQTLELYDSGLSVSADDSSSQSQSCDSPQSKRHFDAGDGRSIHSMDADDGPTLEIWPDESAPATNISLKKDGDWSWDEDGFSGGMEMASFFMKLN